MSWEIKRLGSVIEILSGFAFDSKLFSESKGVPLIRIRDIKRSFSETFYSGDYLEKYIVKRGDVLIGMDGEFNIAEWTGVDALLNQRVCKIASYDTKLIDKRFLLYFLPMRLKEIEDKASFVTVKHLSVNDIKEIEIPLPPLPIQQRIAEILDAADALRRKDQELVRKYDELAQAVFIDMFGDPVKNEKGWEVKTVIDYCDCIVPGRDKPKSFSGTTPWVTTDDLKHLGITTGSKKSIGLNQREIKEVKAKIIPFYSVIMTCVGDLGVVSVNDSEIVINQQLHAFQCGEKMNPFFLMYNLSYQKDYMYKMASSTTVPYMNKTICNSIPVICPPIVLQELFARKIENIRQQNKILDNDISQNLFNSLLQQAFKGELVK